MSLASQVTAIHKAAKEHKAKVVNETAGMPAKFEIAMSKLDNKPVQKQLEIYKYILRNLAERMSDKPANAIELKAWAAHFLSSIQHGVDNISDSEGELEESDNDIIGGSRGGDVEDAISMFDDAKVGELLNDYLGKLAKKPVQTRLEKLEFLFKTTIADLAGMSSGDKKAKFILRQAMRKINESFKKGLAQTVIENYSDRRLPKRRSISERDGLGNSKLKLLREVDGKLYYYFPKGNSNLIYIADKEPEMGVVKHLQSQPQDAIGTKIKVPFWTLGGNSHMMTIHGFEGGKVIVGDDRNKNGFTATPEEVAILMTITKTVERPKGTDAIKNSKEIIAQAKKEGAADIVSSKKAFDDLMKSLIKG